MIKLIKVKDVTLDDINSKHILVTCENGHVSKRYRKWRWVRSGAFLGRTREEDSFPQKIRCQYCYDENKKLIHTLDKYEGKDDS